MHEREQEAEENRRERERAVSMARQMRVERLFWRLWGLPMEIAEKIAATVYQD
jgi:hypothetical protein